MSRREEMRELAERLEQDVDELPLLELMKVYVACEKECYRRFGRSPAEVMDDMRELVRPA
jgi:hypothetical protein